MRPALPEQTIPASTFMIFQAMFAAITPGNTSSSLVVIILLICFISPRFRIGS